MSRAPHAEQDWKDKYLSALEDHEKQQRRQQQMLQLLSKAVVRVSLLADGIDTQLDQQLNGLRKVLRDEQPRRADLSTVFDALEGQVKRLETVKSERAKVVMAAFQDLLKQLGSLKLDSSAKQHIGRLKKQVKGSAGHMQYYSSLLHEYADLQQQVLDGQLADAPATSWLRRLVGHGKSEQSLSAEPVNDAVGDREGDSTGVVLAEDSVDEPEILVAKNNSEDTPAAIEISAAVREPELEQIPAPQAEEPPFSRISRAICDVLSELLRQIEPPPSARANYEFAQQQIEKGLNWYELVPTLEEISIVVVSAFDRDQKEFEQFLAKLNQRLSEAYRFIASSRELSGQALEAGQVLNDSVREQVSAMQQSVADAADLEQLKAEVSSRLDHILSAVDRFQGAEQQREQSLAEQLDALVSRVKEMEAASASAELRIEEQRQKALRDVLTQLPNRESYQQRLEQEYQRWKRYGRPLALAVCDIDFFKKINDGYGHLAGDKVLRIVAKSLAKRLRKTDFVARYGGEEFVVLMPETDVEQAFKVMDAMREAIAKCPFHFKEKPVSITLSFGVTGFAESDQPDEVFLRADKALYQAKHQGRNCGCLAGE